MSSSEHWLDIPDEVFGKFQRRLELVEHLLDENLSMHDKTIRRYLYLYMTFGSREDLTKRYLTTILLVDGRETGSTNPFHYTQH